MLQAIQKMFKKWLRLHSGFSWKNQLRLHSYFWNSFKTPARVHYYTPALVYHWCVSAFGWTRKQKENEI